MQGYIFSDQGSGSTLVINREANVSGAVISDTVMISGCVEGNVIAQHRVEIFRKGVLKGDIYTNEIMIEGGAEFQGQCHMIRDMDADQLRALAQIAPAPSAAKSTAPRSGAVRRISKKHSA